MAVTLTTDIVADVMRAAQPERLQEARAKLRSMGTGDATPVAAAYANRAPDREQALVKFDAMVLGSFVEAMLPTESENVYGGGLAGDMWKSMLAQEIAGALAERGAIQLASRYIGDRYADGDVAEPLRGVADPATRAVLDGQSGLSRSLVDELQRKALDAISNTSGISGD